MTDRVSFAAKIESEGRRLKGSVTLLGARTFRDGEWVEVDPKALMKADASNVIATIDHELSKVMGRTTNGTLSLNRTEQGIDFETADLPNTTAANDALELARGHYFGGSSFSIEGLRSKFSIDPADGLRVRTINSIKRLSDVALVMDPAFSTSMAAAFSKESDVTDKETNPPAPEPEPTPEPEPAPAKFSEKPKKSSADEWAATAEAFSNEQIEATMDSIFTSAKGKPTGELLDRYEGFARVLAERKKVDAETRTRAERFELLHNLRMGRVPKAPEAGLYESDDYKAAFNKYVRSGDKVNMEQFAQSIAGDGTQGGYMVPDGFLKRIVETQKAYGGIARVADSITTTDGIPLRWASNDDTANVASIAAEGNAGSTGADKVFGEVTLGAFSYDATGASNLPIKVSKELLQDAAFDVEAFLGKNLGTRIGRKQAADFATGDGSGKPTGLLSKTPDTMTASTMLAALIEHTFQVDAAYRDAGNCKWVLSDTVLAKVYGSVDGNGRPLFIPQAQSGGSDRPAGLLLGYPVIIDNAAAELVAFGDISQGFIIRYVRGVQVDVDPYTYISTRQIGYHAWARADSNIQDAAAYSVSDYTGVSADS